MNGSGSIKTLLAGAALAATLGCTAGTYLRPQTERPNPGRTLVITQTADAGASASLFYGDYDPVTGEALQPF